MLWQKGLPGADLVIRGARVLDPVEGIDALLEVRIDAGTIAERETPTLVELEQPDRIRVDQPARVLDDPRAQPRRVRLLQQHVRETRSASQRLVERIDAHARSGTSPGHGSTVPRAIEASRPSTG